MYMYNTGIIRIAKLNEPTTTMYTWVPSKYKFEHVQGHNNIIFRKCTIYLLRVSVKCTDMHKLPYSWKFSQEFNYHIFHS